VRRNPLVRQLVKFGLVGLTNSAISIGADAILLAAGVPYLVASVIAFAIAAVNSYVWNCRWTFRARDERRARVAFGLVQVIGLSLTVAAVALIVTLTHADHLVAYLAAVPFATIGMFIANRTWTFRVAKEGLLA
jgi:putative flippase GtrA